MTSMTDHYSKAKDFLDLEASAIQRAAGAIDPESINNAITTILACQGKLIVVGVGKSGFIAQKIAQTLTSTGTIAVFVHPSDALHGGLGVIADGDVVIALSNSGETDEILTILPTIRRRSVAIIAIVGDLDSTLADKADIVLDASVDKEACPLNLAPTASTTVALAIGDALAMTLMEAKGLTPEDFAANHPAGQLGKRLTLRVSDLMHPSPDILPDAAWLEVVKALSKHALGAVNVVTGDHSLIGIITDGDLRRAIERTDGGRIIEMTACEMMTPSPVTVLPDMLAYDALRLMEDRPSQIAVLPVTQGEVCVGMLRLHDIVRSGL